jgi:hypothetical protein
MGNKLFLVNVGSEASKWFSQPRLGQDKVHRLSERQVEDATARLLLQLTVVSAGMLCNDPHENTQFYAIVARKEVIDAALLELCGKAQQDCVAVWDVTAQEGYLIGPRTEYWAPFNPEYFVVPDRLKCLIKPKD